MKIAEIIIDALKKIFFVLFFSSLLSNRLFANDSKTTKIDEFKTIIETFDKSRILYLTLDTGPFKYSSSMIKEAYDIDTTNIPETLNEVNTNTDKFFNCDSSILNYLNNFSNDTNKCNWITGYYLALHTLSSHIDFRIFTLMRKDKAALILSYNYLFNNEKKYILLNLDMEKDYNMLLNLMQEYLKTNSPLVRKQMLELFNKKFCNYSKSFYSTCD